MILVTGCNGQLGSELKLALSSDEAIFVDRASCDITNIEQLEKIIIDNNISSILNCAAYTAVDLAETEIDKAFLINEIGAFNVATVAKKYSLTLVHISTDYVFEGVDCTPRHEDQPVNPSSVYGKSKLAGEQKIMEIKPNGIIIRTSWVYSKFGKNFVKTILKACSEREFLKVVYDQVGSPTNACDLAKLIVSLLPKLQNEACEIYHYSNEGAISWYDFAQAICELKNLPCKVFPIESDEYVTRAPRPAYSVLSKSKLKKKFGIEIPYWRESLKNYLGNIV
jgi:dTDP-4-dehydrorhamnose reductase